MVLTIHVHTSWQGTCTYNMARYMYVHHGKVHVHTTWQGTCTYNMARYMYIHYDIITVVLTMWRQDWARLSTDDVTPLLIIVV